MFEHCLYGGVGNRWMDKPLNWVVRSSITSDAASDAGSGPASEGVEIGMCGEHSGADGYPMLVAVKTVLDAAIHSTTTTPPPTTITTPATWERIRFGTNGLDAMVEKTVATGLSRVTQFLAQSITGQTYTWEMFGKQGIKHQLKVSPDAFVQTALQVAYARAFPTSYPVPTYETASTRHHFRGRTEAIRVASIPMVAFASAFASHTTDGLSPPPDRSAWDAAIARHVELSREARAGAGIDRHLLGLAQARSDLGEAGYVAILDDPASIASRQWKLSTSQVSDPVIAAGFGPVMESGFGVCYGVLPDHIDFRITSDPSCDLQAFISSLHWALSHLWTTYQVSNL